MEQVKITLVKSLIGRGKKQILTANSLGLHKPGDSAVANKDAALEGKINVITHLITVDEVK